MWSITRSHLQKEQVTNLKLSRQPIMSYTGIENGLEFENALASSQFYCYSTDFSRDVLRHIFRIRPAEKNEQIPFRIEWASGPGVN
jgi:hypothetical protein